MRARASPSAGAGAAGAPEPSRGLLELAPVARDGLDAGFFDALDEDAERERFERDFTPAWSHDYDGREMSEPNVLYTMAAVVIGALLVWVAVVLATVKTPWARALAAREASALEPGMPPAGASESGAATPTGGDADTTSEATAVVVRDDDPSA